MLRRVQAEQLDVREIEWKTILEEQFRNVEETSVQEGDFLSDNGVVLHVRTQQTEHLQLNFGNIQLLLKF